MKPPDIILLVLDTQRADRLGCYGYPRSLTPQLDAFAHQGAIFQQGVSPAQWTIPSHASLFTGLYPSLHQVTQSHHSLSSDVAHVAELVHAAGYETVAFCNNPLVGVLNNGFKRGFERFYNYGGAIPNPLEQPQRLPWLLARLIGWFTYWLWRISLPIQDFFGRSDLAFRLSLNAWLTPLWSRFANFKGQNERSVTDVVRFLEERERQSAADQRPLFLFINLMETHLPFWPPAAFLDQVAPYIRLEPAARQIMHRWNREAYRWAAPLAEPLAPLEERVLSDLYDAEVAYQDSYLGQLFAALGRRQHQADTLTLVVGDHGDGHGDHGYVGHAFVAYQELVRVPLLLHWPRIIPPQTTVAAPVSTRRIYHTIVDAAGVAGPAAQGAADQLSLLPILHGLDPEQGTAFAEIYPPLNFVHALASRQPALLERYQCRALRRAIVQGEHKLIHLDDQPHELFDLRHDPLELDSRPLQASMEAEALSAQLHHFAALMRVGQNGLTAGEAVDLTDADLQRQLRGLGYLD